MYYLLADGIYPDLTIFLKTISDPHVAKYKLYAKRQEALRKDVERCFGVLFDRFHMLENPSLQWSSEMMKLIWQCCCSLHNMNIEDEEELEDMEEAETMWRININRQPLPTLSFERFMEYSNEIRDKENHLQLCDDLIDHLWSRERYQ